MAEEELDSFQIIDKALNKYYRALGRYDYYDDEDLGKFMEFCEENGLDAEDIEDELDDPQTCMYCEFDDDFPFIDEEKDLNQKRKNEIIFDIIKDCYLTTLPPDRYRPRKKNLTHPRTTSVLVDAYIYDIAKGCIATDNNPIIVPKAINQLCTKYELNRYNLMAPYDFNMDISNAVVQECETLFSHIILFQSKDLDKADWESVAIGYANNGFPWILSVLETYDRDRIRRGCKPELKEFPLQEWMKECDFLNEYLLQERDKKVLYDSIEKACLFYIRKWKNEMRVLPSNLEMERMYIKDDLYEMTDVILGVYRFVKELYAQYPNGTKFQCDFAVAVRSTDQEILTIQVGTGNETEEDKKVWIHNDRINDILLTMRSNGLPHVHRIVKDRRKIHEDLHAAWKPFKREVESGKYAERSNQFGEVKSDEARAKYYTPFPTRRRFCCFIDRREYYHKTTFRKQMRDMMHGRGMKRERMMGMMGMFGMMGMYEWVRSDKRIPRNLKEDEICFFIPDDQYLPTEAHGPKTRIIPERYFEINHQSMIPELRVWDVNKEEKHLAAEAIKGITSLKGAMFNIQFHCERYDEIRMYIHWHNQNIRLYPEDFWLFLPRIFVKDYARNADYPNDPKVKQKIRANFEMPDKYFEYFHKYLSIYHQQPKDWIDKQTEDKYVN